MRKVSFIFLIIQLSILNTNAQNIDSLKQELTVTKKDTNQFKILTELYWHYIKSYPDSAFPYAQKAYELSKEIKYDAGIRYSLDAMSGVAHTLNNYKQALNYALMSLPLFTKAKDTIG